MTRNQLTLFGGTFLAIVAILSAIYVLAFRQDYVVLYDNIREQDSAAIIGELENEGIAFELANKGTRVLVEESEADRARVVVAGAGIPLGGVIGFELFNESDMGLTDFAQKVNYQRALQGELARTIMMMEGITFARVHLSLPERTLFRANSPEPKAAVTVQAGAGRKVDEGRVAGIQQLVSSSVTGLTAREVAVLNENGVLVSAVASDNSAKDEVLDERSALEEYYRARAHKAATALFPGLAFQLRVNAMENLSESSPNGADVQRPGTRNFSLRVAFRTEIGIAEDDQSDLRRAITNAVDLKPENGDLLLFEVASFGYDTNLADAPLAGVDGRETPPSKTLANTPTPDWDYTDILMSRWFWFAILAIFVVVLIFLRQRPRMTAEEQQNFAEVLGEQLVRRKESQHG